MADARIPAVGIDLGTTFSVIAHLDASGRPTTIVNAEGDLTTPSVVLFDGEDVVVALMADSVKLRNVGRDTRVALVVDDYREDWDANAGLMLRGRVRFLEDEEWRRARRLLYQKFTQYEHLAPIEHDAIVSIAVDHAASWGV